MAFMVWKEEYSVGIPSLDGQHKKLVALIEETHEAMIQGKANAALRGIIDKMVRYAGEHFETEERLFAKHSYPGTLSHKLKHEAFRKEVATFQEKLEGGAVTVSLSVMKFLKNWLVEHIIGEDKKYGPFLAARGEK